MKKDNIAKKIFEIGLMVNKVKSNILNLMQKQSEIIELIEVEKKDNKIKLLKKNLFEIDQIIEENSDFCINQINIAIELLINLCKNLNDMSNVSKKTLYYLTKYIEHLYKFNSDDFKNNDNIYSYRKEIILFRINQKIDKDKIDRIKLFLNKNNDEINTKKR